MALLMAGDNSLKVRCWYSHGNEEKDNVRREKLRGSKRDTET